MEKIYRELIGRPEIAQHLGISNGGNVVSFLESRGLEPVQKIGKVCFYDRLDVIKAIEESKRVAEENKVVDTDVWPHVHHLAQNQAILGRKSDEAEGRLTRIESYLESVEKRMSQFVMGLRNQEDLVSRKMNSLVTLEKEKMNQLREANARMEELERKILRHEVVLTEG